jgi:hypothetical protein
LILEASAATIPERGWIKALDATNIKRPGGVLSIDGLTAGSVPTLQHQREVIAQMRQNRIPEFANMLYNCHIDPVSETRIFADTEFQALFQSRPEHQVVTGAELGTVMGTMYQRNTESPQPGTVVGYDATGTGAYSVDDPFPGELKNATDIVVHRMLYSGASSVHEHYVPGGNYTSDSGASTQVSMAAMDDSGIQMDVDRITFLVRGPQNKWADMMSFTWKYSADWVQRTDVLSGDAQRHKRHVVLEHA